MDQTNSIHCPHCLRAIDRALNAAAKGRLAIKENVETEIRAAADGRLLDVRYAQNLILDAGLRLVPDLIDVTAGGISHFRVGTNSTAPAAGQTDLLAAVYQNVVSQRLKGNFFITHRCFIPAQSANGSTLREAALANALTGGTMFSRVVHDDIVKTVAITVTHSWTHSFARG